MDNENLRKSLAKAKILLGQVCAALDDVKEKHDKALQYYSSKYEDVNKHALTVKPWSLETFPLNKSVWVRKKGINIISKIVSIDSDFVYLFRADKANIIPWDELLINYERVMTDRSVQPCGVNTQK